MNKLTIINLDNSTDYYFEIHATGCGDITKKAGYTVEMDSFQDVLGYIDGDDLGFTIEDHCKTFDCAKKVGA
jgi:hypothetical protein|tara:strand:+ start:3164 stop:3379 length:216 start_codon:yes stop_codon:yes gene_type:complete